MIAHSRLNQKEQAQERQRQTIEAEAGFEAEGVARAEAAHANARVLQKLLGQLQRLVIWRRDLKAVLTSVPVGMQVRNLRAPGIQMETVA
jgi:hypothetical protein